MPAATIRPKETRAGFLRSTASPGLGRRDLLMLGWRGRLGGCRPGGRPGVFFHYVIEGLKSSADQESGNRDNKVSLAELTAFTQDKVLDFVSHRRGRRQMPTLQGRAGLVTLLDVPRGFSGDDGRLPGYEVRSDQGRRVLDGLAGHRQGCLRRREAPAQVRITRPFYLGVYRSPAASSAGSWTTGIWDQGREDGKGGWGWDGDAKKFEQNPRYTWHEAGSSRPIFTRWST